MIYFVIPARKGSKGLPFKNRLLFKYTADEIVNPDNVIVTTDDDVIIEKAMQRKFRVIKRSSELSGDKASMKNVLLDVVNQCNLDKDDIIVLLYLTYPERKLKSIFKILSFFKSKKAKSLLCKKEVETSPYLYMIAKDEYHGKQLKKHNLYRRQDYPGVFEISHFVGMFRVNEIKKLNKNLYNSNTFFYGIEDVIDIDCKEDLVKYENLSIHYSK